MFVGRNEYLDDLNSLWRKSTSSLVACRGRRRVGKSTLIEHFAEKTADVFLSFEGLPPRKGMTNRNQLDNFGTALARQTNQPRIVLETWHDVFFWLDKAVEDRKKTVILLDEISWMGRYDPDFPGHLKWAWDKLFHRHRNLVMVVCGSVSAWIRENILDNTGFAGRFSRDDVLPELPLSLCPAFSGASTYFVHACVKSGRGASSRRCSMIAASRSFAGRSLPIVWSSRIARAFALSPVPVVRITFLPFTYTLVYHTRPRFSSVPAPFCLLAMSAPF